MWDERYSAEDSVTRDKPEQFFGSKLQQIEKVKF